LGAKREARREKREARRDNRMARRGRREAKGETTLRLKGGGGG
jgi:hypothetical protein